MFEVRRKLACSLAKPGRRTMLIQLACNFHSNFGHFYAFLHDYWLSHVACQRSGNEHASFIRTSDVLTHSCMLIGWAMSTLSQWTNLIRTPDILIYSCMLNGWATSRVNTQPMNMQVLFELRTFSRILSFLHLAKIPLIPWNTVIIKKGTHVLVFHHNFTSQWKVFTMGNFINREKNQAW